MFLKLKRSKRELISQKRNSKDPIFGIEQIRFITNFVDISEGKVCGRRLVFIRKRQTFCHRESLLIPQGYLSEAQTFRWDLVQGG